MSDVVGCIVNFHDLRLVAVAVLVCLTGSVATVKLFERIRAAQGGSRSGWIVLTAVGTGTMVWCTHFVAMMAFHAGVPVTLDPELTLVSLAIAIGLAAPGLALAASDRRALVLPGGAIVGLSISAMHYVGMAAYRIDGIVAWRWPYVAASVIVSALLSALAFRMLRQDRSALRIGGGLVLGLAVVALHFTGMTAMKITMLQLHTGDGLAPASKIALAVATASAGLLFVTCTAVSALIDGRTQSDGFVRLRRMALHDGLTDLPNRMRFHEELAARLYRKGGTAHLAVIMLDLSRFKSVNETYGHQAGDQLLVALAARLSRTLDEASSVARLGGDEFAALLSYDTRNELDAFLHGQAEVFADPFVFERFSVAVAAHIGIALAPQDGEDADTLLACADLAMSRAKKEHSPVPCFYDSGMDEAARDRRELTGELREAITNGAFELHYQVQASTDTGEIAGYEALVRWRHPTRGLIPPGLFIPLAEEAGEIVPLSIWIMNQACFEAALWPGRHVVAVNLSPLHLSDPGLLGTVRDALESSGLSPDRLVLELTESAIIRDRDYALAQLFALKALGVRLALDDFGVGYSSLDVLRSFPFDKIKLDASFVAEIDKDDQAVAILRSVAALGTTLHIPVLAEGVEEPSQLRIVAREGCSSIQGYLIGRPSRELADPQAVRAVVQTAMERHPRAVVPVRMRVASS